MVYDFIILLRMEWKRGRVKAIEWLRLIGYDPKGNRLYRLYFWLFWAFWLFAMWSFSVEQVYQLSLTLPAHLAEAMFTGIPVLIFALQLAYLAHVLHDEPLKLEEASLAYVAFSPINRGSIVILEFGRSLLTPALFMGIISCFLTMLLTWHSAPNTVGVAGLSAFFAAIALVYLSAALAWALALWKISSERRGWFFWLALPVSILVGVFVPGVMLFPGHLWQNAAKLIFPAVDAIGFLTAFAAALACLIAIGNRVPMSVIADASQTYMRIQRLGFFGQWYARDVIDALAQQNHLTHTGRLSLKLSKRKQGYGVLWNRAAIALYRMLPGSILQPILVSSSLTLMVITIVRIGGWQAVQSWVLVLLVLSLVRLRAIPALFRQDLTRSFLRQMIPMNNLALFAADAGYIVLLSALASMGTILLQRWETPLVVMLLGLMSVTALGLAQALELVEERLLVHRRIPFEYSVVLGGGMVILLGAALHSLWAAAGGLLLLNATLSILLYYSHPL